LKPPVVLACLPFCWCCSPSPDVAPSAPSFENLALPEVPQPEPPSVAPEVPLSEPCLAEWPENTVPNQLQEPLLPGFLWPEETPTTGAPPRAYCRCARHNSEAQQ
jgi:hypothetical protein